jgi:hypothetical protein
MEWLRWLDALAEFIQGCDALKDTAAPNLSALEQAVGSKCENYQKL